MSRAIMDCLYFFSAEFGMSPLNGFREKNDLTDGWTEASARTVSLKRIIVVICCSMFISK